MVIFCMIPPLQSQNDCQSTLLSQTGKLCFTANKTKRTKMEDKIINLQSERLLFSRCAIVANSDRDLDMMSVIGNYELDVIPRSLMKADRKCI